MAEREHDVVLLGATGFTGALTAGYLLKHAPEHARLGLAGRNAGKLAGVAEAVGDRDGRFAQLIADTGDDASLRRLAASTRVLITTVGPYLSYGEPVVRACAEAGTDYVDLTGEPEFVDRMYLSHHEAAVRTGARLVHSCGFDSIPYDLGALFTVEHLPEGVPVRLTGFVRASGTFSGGTYHSAIGAVGRLRQAAATARERRRREGGPGPGRRVTGSVGTPHRDPTAGGWVVPFPTIDPQTVLRSARALERYGPDFTYSHYLVAGGPATAAALAGGAAGFIALAQLPPGRALLRRLKSPGDGPSEEQRARARFRVLMAGEGGGRRVVAEVTGGDPGYGETSKMLSESALCLAFDELPDTAGQVTPAVAMGDALVKRLQAAGIGFEVLEDRQA